MIIDLKGEKMKRKSAILVVVLASISFFLMILIIWALMKTRPKPPEPPVIDPEEETVALQEEEEPNEEDADEQTPPDEDEPAEQTPPDEEAVEEEPEEETGDGQVPEENHNNEEETSDAIADDPDEDSRPDAIICAFDSFALACAHALTEAGVKIPSDTAIAGFDNSISTSYSVPQLTSVQSPAQDFGWTAARLLAGIMRGEITEERHLRVHPKVIERGSTDPDLK